MIVFASVKGQQGGMPLKSIRIIILFFSLLWGCSAVAEAPSAKQQQNIQGFIDKMVQQHQFNREELTALFASVNIDPDVIKAMSRPYESRPWNQYKNLLLTNERIQGGLAFWKKHAKALARAEKLYGVPAQIIVAIIGIETNYGETTGDYSVLDTLTTLSFAYPRRSAFFRSELEEYLLLTREEGLNPKSLNGSYAGAIGQPQFMPSNVRKLAVDFSNSGQINLQGDSKDAIGSVANFLKHHGWQRNQMVAIPANIQGKGFKLLNQKSKKTQYTQAILESHGVEAMSHYPNGLKSSLVNLPLADGTEHWIGFHNFFVITRYNPSNLYAMAVYQLSEQIQALRAQQVANTP